MLPHCRYLPLKSVFPVACRPEKGWTTYRPANNQVNHPYPHTLHKPPLYTLQLSTCTLVPSCTDCLFFYQPLSIYMYAHSHNELHSESRGWQKMGEWMSLTKDLKNQMTRLRTIIRTLHFRWRGSAELLCIWIHKNETVLKELRLWRTWYRF